MIPDYTIADLDAHRRQATLAGYTVGYADITEKWVLVCPQGNYRGSYPNEEAAWRAAPRMRRATPRR